MKPLKAAGALLVCLGLFVVVDYLIAHIRFAEPLLTGDLSNLQSKQVDVSVQAAQQLLTLATLLLAGVGALAMDKKRFRDRNWPLWIAAGLAAFSIYVGYVRLDKIVWMLSKGFCNLQWPLLWWLSLFQFWGFVAAAGLLAWNWLAHPENNR